MALPEEGMVIRGGMVTIQFPHMKAELSVDNETEMNTAIEMMKKALELHETEQAKMALIRDIESEERAKKHRAGSAVSGPTAAEIREKQRLVENYLRTHPQLSMESQHFDHIADSLKYGLTQAPPPIVGTKSDRNT